MRRLRRLYPLAALVAFAALVVSSAQGCSTQAAPVGAGGACELATDCQGGLYCYKNACTGDAGAAQQLAPTPDAGSGTGTGGEAGSGTGTTDAEPATDAPSSSPLPEASVSD